MPRCEDYPCCGHEPNGCPDSQGRFPCVECGRKLPKHATSSICPSCMKAAHRRYAETGEMWPENPNDY